jgi:hypothetical protein
VRPKPSPPCNTSQKTTRPTIMLIVTATIRSTEHGSARL